MKTTATHVAAAFALCWALVGAHGVALAADARVTVFDDGEKLRGERERPLPAAPWASGPVSLFAFPGETLALQIVIDADEKLDGIHAELGAVRALDGGATIPIALTSFAQRFVRVARPSGNEREPGSLAFTVAAAPPTERFVGLVADALVPRPLDLEAGARGALWVDLFVPNDTVRGVYEARVTVASSRGALAPIEVRIEVGAQPVPFDATHVTAFYDPVTLDKRMGGRAAEPALRRLFHAHHMSAMPERTSPDDLDLDLRALTGELYTEANGYRGPGMGVGEGVFAIGAYGSLGEPSEDKVPIVERFVERIAERGALEKTTLFLYAVDESCKSPRAARWTELLERSRAKGKLLVGVTCGDPPAKQDAALVMNPAASYDPDRVAEGRARGKIVWAYNGMRPHAGPLMLDVPAVDLRANAWIAMRWDVTRWFYWESSYYLDNHGGGKGGAVGWDPYVVAETFHNKDGDYANHDGILVYPGTQKSPGMTDLGEDTFYPSVRLKNLRRGVLDAGYIALARKKDALRANRVVERIVPRALATAGDRAAWPDDATSFRDARRELFDIAEGPFVSQPLPPKPPPTADDVLRGPFGRLLLVLGTMLGVLFWLRRSLSR